MNLTPAIGWKRLPRAAIIALLIIAYTVIIAPWLWSHLAIPKSRPWMDMIPYVNAAKAVASGQNPYTSIFGYMYPPLLADLMAWLLPAGMPAISAGFHIILVMSGLIIVAGSIVMLDLHATLIGPISMLLLYSQAIQEGIVMGNVSLIAAALIVASGLLITKYKSPMTSGILLAAGAYIKVMPAIFVVYLFLRWYFIREKALLITAVTAVVFSAIGLLLPHTLEYLQMNMSGSFTDIYFGRGSNFSWFGYMSWFGIHLPLWVLMAAGGILTFITAQSVSSVRLGWAGISCAALVASPVVWNHTWSMAVLPVLAIGTELLHGKRFIPEDTIPARILEWMIVGLGVFILFSVEFFYGLSWSGRHLAPLIPLLLPLFYSWVYVRLDRQDRNSTPD